MCIKKVSTAHKNVFEVLVGLVWHKHFKKSAAHKNVFEVLVSFFTFKNIPKHFETQSLQLKCPKIIHWLAVWLEKIIKSSHQIARDFVDTFSADTDTDTADPRSSRGHNNTIVCRLLPEMFPPQPNCINNQLSKYLPSTDPLFCNLFFLYN